MGSATVEQNGK